MLLVTTFLSCQQEDCIKDRSAPHLLAIDSLQVEVVEAVDDERAPQSQTDKRKVILILHTLSVIRDQFPPRKKFVYAVIWDSMKMRMKTRMAGRMLAPIIQAGNCPSDPRGEISQPRFSGLETENPLGTLSFCRPIERQ